MIVKVKFEDDGQDVSWFLIDFDDSYILGNIIHSDMQSSIWKKYFVLSGKPVVGQLLKISESPKHGVIELKHAIQSIENGKQLWNLVPSVIF